MRMVKRTFMFVCLASALLLVRAPNAAAYGFTSPLYYDSGSDILGGYSATWKDSWDPDSGWEFDDECECSLYWEDWVSVEAELYRPSGGLQSSGYTYDFYYAELDLNPGTPPENGVWSQFGNHYIETYWYDEDGSYLGSETSYLGGSAGQASVSCGDGGLDALVTEYRSRNLRPIPSCYDFKLIDSGALVSTYFTWGEVNHPEDNSHGWAIFTGNSLVGLDGTRDNFGSALRITSGYRCPHINFNTPGADPNSLHMWGKAADMKPK